MLRALYDWTLSLAARRTAELWLVIIALPIIAPCARV